MLFRMAYSELTFDLASRESIVLSCFPGKHRSIGLIDRRACPARYVQAHTFRCGESTVRQCSEAAPMVVVSSWTRGLRLLVIRTFDRARHVKTKHRRPLYGFELNNNSIISATGPRQTSATGPYLLDCFCVIRDLAKKHPQSISRVSSCPSILSNNQSHVSTMVLLTYI